MGQTHSSARTATPSHYELLEVKPSATIEEIKQSFRRLAKLWHPDRNTSAESHDYFQSLNRAYETLSDPAARRVYDQKLHYQPSPAFGRQGDRTSRTESAQQKYRESRQKEGTHETLLDDWLKRVYTPVNRTLLQMTKSLRPQIKALSADPFDDELMEDFQTYLEACRTDLERAQQISRKMPNPPIAAAASANLYYCINQLGDGLRELEFFSQNYDEHYLNDGIEMFRIAEGLRKEAMAAARNLK